MNDREKLIELLSYGFFGAATTAVNYIVYWLLSRKLGLDTLVTNVLAWVAAVAFAYVVNKLFVFRSRSWERSVVVREVWQFCSARLLSLGLEEMCLVIFSRLLGINDLVVKVFAAVLVIILNYAVSKLVIFKKEK